MNPLNVDLHLKSMPPKLPRLAKQPGGTSLENPSPALQMHGSPSPIELEPHPMPHVRDTFKASEHGAVPALGTNASH